MEEYKTFGTTIVRESVSSFTNVFAQLPTLHQPNEPLVTGTLASQLNRDDYALVRITDPEAMYANIELILQRSFPEYNAAADQYQTDVEELERMMQQEQESMNFDSIGTLKQWLLRRTTIENLRKDLKSQKQMDRDLARSISRQLFAQLNEEYDGILDEQYQRRIRDWLQQDDTDDAELYSIFEKVDSKFKGYTRQKRTTSDDPELEKPEIMEKLPALVESMLKGEEAEPFGQYTPEYIHKHVGYFLNDDRTLMLARVTGFSDERIKEDYAELVPFNKDSTVPEGVNYRPLAKVTQDVIIMEYVIISLWQIAAQENQLVEPISEFNREHPNKSIPLGFFTRGRLPNDVTSGYFLDDESLKKRYGNDTVILVERAAEIFEEYDAIQILNTFFTEREKTQINIGPLENLFSQMVHLVPSGFYLIARQKVDLKGILENEFAERRGWNRAKRRKFKNISDRKLKKIAIENGKVERNIDILIEQFGEEAGKLLDFEPETIEYVVHEALELYASSFMFTRGGVADLINSDYG